MTGLPASNPRQLPMTGRLVVGHPERVAQADQVAAGESITRVVLSDFCPTGHVYVIDLDALDALMKLPGEGFFP